MNRPGTGAPWRGGFAPRLAPTCAPPRLAPYTVPECSTAFGIRPVPVSAVTAGCAQAPSSSRAKHAQLVRVTGSRHHFCCLGKRRQASGWSGYSVLRICVWTCPREDHWHVQVLLRECTDMTVTGLEHAKVFPPGPSPTLDAMASHTSHTICSAFFKLRCWIIIMILSQRCFLRLS